jgi:hypothetical protein
MTRANPAPSMAARTAASEVFTHSRDPIGAESPRQQMLKKEAGQAVVRRDIAFGRLAGVCKLSCMR